MHVESTEGPALSKDARLTASPGSSGGIPPTVKRPEVNHRGAGLCLHVASDAEILARARPPWAVNLQNLDTALIRLLGKVAFAAN